MAQKACPPKLHPSKVVGARESDARAGGGARNDTGRAVTRVVLLDEVCFNPTFLPV